jgi:hypothetical protein
MLATLGAVASCHSLRAAAATMSMHHSTVQDRLAHAERLLGWPVQDHTAGSGCNSPSPCDACTTTPSAHELDHQRRDEATPGVITLSSPGPDTTGTNQK